MQEFWLTIKKNVCLASTGAEKAQEKKKSMAQRQDLAVWVYLTLLSQKKKKKKVKASFLTN